MTDRDTFICALRREGYSYRQIQEAIIEDGHRGISLARIQVIAKHVKPRKARPGGRPRTLPRPTVRDPEAYWREGMAGRLF